MSVFGIWYGDNHWLKTARTNHTPEGVEFPGSVSETIDYFSVPPVAQPVSLEWIRCRHPSAGNGCQVRTAFERNERSNVVPHKGEQYDF